MSKSSGNKRKKRRFYKTKRFWLTPIFLLLIGAGVAYVAAERYTREFRERAETYDLEKINQLEIPSIILGSDGEEIGRIFVQNRSVISVDEVPKNFIDALRAGEDKRFYEHGGFDAIGIVRAAKDWFTEKEAVSGASTITQQLARGAYPLQADTEKLGEGSLERKIVEIFLAMRIEKRYPKDQILEFYLNRIYFGSGFYGIRSASLGYFGKEPSELNDLECATIVGLIKNPTNLSPLNNIEDCKVARNMVVGRMYKLGAINRKEAGRMFKAPIELNPKPLRRGTSHVYERIADEIQSLIGEESLTEGGLTIRTTIDSKVQKAAEKQLEASLRKAEAHQSYQHPTPDNAKDPKQYLQGAVLMVDHSNGSVIAHVGGRNYAEAPFDMIELGRRPLGTAFHPIIYSAALESGMTPASRVYDEPMDNRAVMVGGREGILGEWGMEIPNPRYEDEITLRRALESSKVAATVRIASDTGLDKVVQTAKTFGLPMDEVELLPRLAVGWESASLKEAVRAYSAFSAGGQLGPEKLWLVKRIDDVNGNIRFNRPTLANKSPNAISDATAFQIHNIMQGGMIRGSAAGVIEDLDEVPFPGAGKPGTTHDFSDNWFLGYNGRVTCGVWVGYLQDGKTIYEGAFARDLAMPVWTATMSAARKSYPGRGIVVPNSVVETSVCRVSGERATPYCYEMIQDPETGRTRSTPTAIKEYFRRGTEKIAFCSVHSGSAPVDPGEGAIDLTALAVIDTSPVRPQEPTLLGEDPYHSIHLTSENAPKTRFRGSGRTNVLDSLDLNDELEGVTLPRPDRLEISPD